MAATKSREPRSHTRPSRTKQNGTVRATVDDGARSRFFDGTLNERLRELFDNARRSRTTRIDISVTDGPPGSDELLVRVADDGVGIDDPALVLHSGAGRRDRGNDETGMSFDSLACTDCVIESRPRRGGDARGWRLRLSREHWDGTSEARVEDLRPDEGPCRTARRSSSRLKP